jgi:predicted short-subunit dehydrogenase-like oxidoreductase (DUF2520 family)
MRVVVLGVGRLGGSLLPLLRAAGVDVVGWSRGESVPRGADVYWITTRDDSVAEVARQLPPDAVALHAAGAHGPELLGDRRERGVLHPLMTFPGPALGLPDLRGVGARVDGTPRAVQLARTLAERLGMRPFSLPGDVRLYHAAATVASGHAAALFLDAAGLLARAGLSDADARALLLPLALESLRRVSAGGPDAITGPAARGDDATVRGHLDALGPADAALYVGLSERIRALRQGR